ncbi:MAG: hypothetical protein EXR79_10985 [Myxococcales bacterium]|nr:hypothetical protein [Myxococcales bacterium]
MHLVFLVTAALGCTLLVVQIVLQLIGSGHADLPHDGGAELHVGDHAGDSSTAFASILSLKSLTAFCAFFGLGGLAAEEANIASDALRAVLATLCGVAAMAAVVVMMRGIARLQVSGTLDVGRAVGLPATVYLRVPGAMAGTGKITVSIEGREAELLAMTSGPEIPTGARVHVRKRIDAQTFEVERNP